MVQINGLENGVVYKSYISHYQPDLDMPLDFMENELELFRYKQTYNRSAQKLHEVAGSPVDELL